MLKIGTFSKLSRVSIRMLRHYDEIGLLRPALIDPETGYRYYAEAQLRDAGRIQALKELGFSLASVAALLVTDDPGAVERAFRQRRAELNAEIAEATCRLRLLDTATERLRKDGTKMNQNVTVKTIPARKAACVRMTLPRYDAEGMRYPESIEGQQRGVSRINHRQPEDRLPIGYVDGIPFPSGKGYRSRTENRSAIFVFFRGCAGKTPQLPFLHFSLCACNAPEKKVY